MPVSVKRGPVQYQPVELEEVTLEQNPDEYSWWERIADSYEVDSYIGQSINAVEQLLARNANFRRGEQYDGLDNIPDGYQQYADAYAWSQNQSETDAITARIDSTKEARARLATLPTMDRLAAGLATGIVDPINLVGGPSFKGAGFLAGAGRGALAIGTVNAGTELLRHSIDPTSTVEETALNIGFGYALAGVVGGAIGHYTRGAAKGGVGTTSLTPEARARVEASGDGFARAVNAVDGIGVVDKISFNGQGVRIIDGPTGKVDAQGNPVRASYVSAADQADAARAARVSRAADDALGDVVPVADDVAEEALGAAPVQAAPARAADNVADQVDEAMPALDMPEPPARAAAVADEAEELGDVITIDSAAIRADFANKPWTKPTAEGGDALPADAFKTEAEWLNYVVQRELYRATTVRGADETAAAFENQLNKLALEDIQGGRLPLSPTDAPLEQLMLLPTPSGTLMRLAPRDVDVHGMAQTLAGDMSTLTLANRAGQPTTAGGSVFQKAHRWLNQYFITHVAMRKAYGKYINGKASESNFMQAVDVLKAEAPFVGTAKKQAKLTYDEFREFIGTAMFNDGPFEVKGKALSDADMAIVREATFEIRKVLNKFELEARELGLFDRQRQAQDEITWREEANARDLAQLESEARPHIAERINDDILARNAEIEEFRAVLDDLADTPIQHRGGEGYFPRIYDMAVIRERYDEFVDLLAEAFARENKVMVTPEIRRRAQETTDRILGEGMEESAFGYGSPRALRSRELPITNTEVADFIITDPMRVIGVYARRMGAAIEMQRQFGSRNLKKQLDKLTSQLRNKGFDEQKITDIRWEMEAMRDRVLGQFHAADPLSFSNRLARALKNLGSLDLLGRGVYSQTVDVFRTVAAEGHRPLFAAARTAMGSGMKGVKPGVYSREAGEGLEMVMSRMMAQLIEDDSALLVTRQTGVERALAGMQAPFFNINLMNPFTVMWKDFTSLMTSHRMIASAKQLSDAVAAGRTKATFTSAEMKVMSELASWGIDLRGAQQIAAMPVEKTGGGLWLANLDEWTGQGLAGERAREVFMGAMSGNLRSNVVTPGPLQRAAIMDGVFQVKKGGFVSRKFAKGSDRLEAPLMSLPFQLLSFTMSASAKINHALLSGRDRNRLVTMGALLSGGMLATWLSAGDRWEQMTLEEIIYSSIDRSGLTGWVMDPVKRIETLTGIGPRSAFDMYAFGEGEINDDIGAVFGPSLGVVSGMIEALTAPNMDDDRRAGLLLRFFPMNGLIWWDESLKALADGAAEIGMIDGPVVDLEGEEMAAEEP
jgi:hypothetical protein